MDNSRDPVVKPALPGFPFAQEDCVLLGPKGHPHGASSSPLAGSMVTFQGPRPVFLTFVCSNPGNRSFVGFLAGNHPSSLGRQLSRTCFACAGFYRLHAALRTPLSRSLRTGPAQSQAVCVPEGAPRTLPGPGLRNPGCPAGQVSVSSTKVASLAKQSRPLSGLALGVP